MFFTNQNAEIVACILSFRKSRHKPNLESTSKYGFSPDLGGKNGGVLSMRMQVILDSSFVRPGSAPIWGGKRGEFRDWTSNKVKMVSNKVYVFSETVSKNLIIERKLLCNLLCLYRLYKVERKFGLFSSTFRAEYSAKRCDYF